MNKQVELTLPVVNVGDRVRSWDQPDCRTGPHAHGIIGTVLAVSVRSVPMENGQEYTFDCPRYAIMVEKYFDENGETLVDKQHIVYPPMNGTPTWMGNICNGVELYNE